MPPGGRGAGRRAPSSARPRRFSAAAAAAETTSRKAAVPPWATRPAGRWWRRLMQFGQLSAAWTRRLAYREIVSRPTCVSSETRHREPDPVRPGVRLAIDVGSARIGVAGSDPDGLLALPVVTARRGRGDLADIATLAA